MAVVNAFFKMRSRKNCSIASHWVPAFDDVWYVRHLLNRSAAAGVAFHSELTQAALARRACIRAYTRALWVRHQSLRCVSVTCDYEYLETARRHGELANMCTAPNNLRRFILKVTVHCCSCEKVACRLLKQDFQQLCTPRVRKVRHQVKFSS